jgi:hypothetical protein
MALAIEPTNPQILYAAGHGLSVVTSTDGGTPGRRKNKDWMGTTSMP